MIKVMVIGAMGRMGGTVCKAILAEPDIKLAAAVDTALTDEAASDSFSLADVPVYDNLAACLEREKVDVAVDFTVPDTVFSNVIACLKKGVHCVVGTTGLTENELVKIESQCWESGANCLVAPNFAIGAVLMMDIAQTVARYMPHCEIIELHHDQKLDAPSGTALKTAEMIAEARVNEPEPAGPEGNVARGLIHKGIPIHSIRLPGLVAHQEIIFAGPGQTLSIRHDSISRESFMPGVIMAVRRVFDIDGLAVGLEKVM